ncbi:MAG: hypothetical protein QG656_2601 [Candidatus Hydrogenedentes bacterium]|nr:hypothetical protein [Candidatus Hydrogenedentota bacterium]
MTTITVQVREDHLEFLSRSRPMAAIAELIWNALDADATSVQVVFVDNELGGLDSVEVRDDGHGLDYGHALEVFKNLGGSWKRDSGRTPHRHRVLHGKYGKGRFRSFVLGNRVEWATVSGGDGNRVGYSIVGRAVKPGEFEVTDPAPAGDAEPGMRVEIADLAPNIELLRGEKALQDVTDLFALYLRQYPDVRIVYDGTPLDPANAEDVCTEYDLGELVTEDGARIQAAMTVVEWHLPGKRGILLCNEHGFALHAADRRPYFRSFSYTAYLKSAYLSALDREGLLDVQDLSPDVKLMVDTARDTLRRHFAQRETERNADVLAAWKETGLYPYDGDPEDDEERRERRIFDIYALHLNQTPDFAGAPPRGKRLNLRLLQELVHSDPMRIPRILDEILSLPGDKEKQVLDLIDLP